VQLKCDRANERFEESKLLPLSLVGEQHFTVQYSLSPRLVCVGFSPVPLSSSLQPRTIIIIIIRDLRAERFIFAAVEDLNDDDSNNERKCTPCHH
jgi:hypothetical protein